MSVRQKPSVFVAGDGEEFATKKEAKLHDDLVQAIQAHDQSKRSLNRLLASSQRTADGELFEVGKWGPYYFVTHRFGGAPCIYPVYFGYGTQFTLGGHNNSEIRLVVTEEGRQPHSVHYAIGDLYHFEINAKRALAVELEKFIVDKSAELADLIQDIQKGTHA